MKEQLALYGAAVMAFVAGHLEKPPTPSEPAPQRSVYYGDTFSIARVTLEIFAITSQSPEDQAPFALSLGTVHLVSQNCIQASSRILKDETYGNSLLEITVSNPSQCFPELLPLLGNN